MVAQRIADQLGRYVHDLNHLVVVHARGANHAQGAHNLAVDFVRGAHHRQLFKRHDLAFAANVDTHAFSFAGEVKQAQYLGFLLKQLKGPAQVAHVAGEITHGQQIAFARDDDLLLGCLRHHFCANVDRCLHQVGHFAAQLVYLLFDALAHLLNIQPCVVGVDEVRGFNKLRC